MQSTLQPSALAPEFAIDKALATMNKKGDLGQLFPNPKDLGDARLAMQWMKRVLTKESASAPGGVSGGAVFGVGGVCSCFGNCFNASCNMANIEKTCI